MNIIPQCRFKLIGLDREAELFYSFMKSDQFSSVFDRLYPELRLIQKGCKDKKDCLLKYKKFLKGLRVLKKENMLEFKEKIEFLWGAINENFVKILSNHFETNWPDDKPEIIAYISSLPVFPRFLDNYQFCIGYKNVEAMIEVIAHEILHFLWFKKWKEVFPGIARKEYESPHLTWRLSEIMDPIILQCYEPIRELIKPKKWGYDYFKKLKVEGIGMTVFFKEIYLDELSKGCDFASILKRLWLEAQKHEMEISIF